MRGLQQAVRALRKAQTVVLAGHINPDGDCIGSLLALGLGLRSKGKRVSMLLAGTTPRMYLRLPGAAMLKSSHAKAADVAVSVDCNTAAMLGKEVWEAFGRCQEILEIDHHEYREPFGTLALIDTKAAAVGEIVYTLLKKLSVRITPDIAQNILTSIIVETNSFRLPSVTSSTFAVCAELLTSGVDFYRLSDMVYWSKTPQAALLSGICLSRVRFLKKGAVVWSSIRQKDFRKVNGRDEDVDAVADEMRSIRGVRVAVLLREQKDRLLRVSIRSKDEINVARLAQRFGGGGHGDVAGCFIPNTRSAVDTLLREVLRAAG